MHSRTSRDIDSKVCNKKVAVDDYNPHGVRGDRDDDEGVATRMKGGEWSCVDYVDSTAKEWDTRRGVARTRNGRELSARFAYTANMERREDDHGECQQEGNAAYRLLAEGGGNMDFCGRDIAGSTVPQVDGVYVPLRRWWTSKETNRGWPGTTSGATDTANGITEDLGAFPRPERNTIAGLLSRTISGAEVVERLRQYIHT